MKAVVQRVNFCRVSIENETERSIDKGLLLLLGIGQEDLKEDANWLARKIVDMRIFSDEDDKMNLSVKDIGGDIMVVSQFTLFANTKKGNRPSFIRSAKPDQAIPLYTYFIDKISETLGRSVTTGEFGAMMKLKFENDGPVTIIMDSKNKE